MRRILLSAFAGLLFITPGLALTTTGPAPDRVWVNTDSKVYHCYGTQYYGKTKNGLYMTEARARAEGDKPAQAKACS